MALNDDKEEQEVQEEQEEAGAGGEVEYSLLVIILFALHVG